MMAARGLTPPGSEGSGRRPFAIGFFGLTPRGRAVSSMASRLDAPLCSACSLEGSLTRIQGRRPVEASSRWRNARSVEPRRDFCAHEFEEHANAPSIVEMHESTKGFGEWPRQNANLLANLKVGVEPNRFRAFGCRHQRH